jgi:hypothetical protein
MDYKMKPVRRANAFFLPSSSLSPLLALRRLGPLLVEPTLLLLLTRLPLGLLETGRRVHVLGVILLTLLLRLKFERKGNVGQPALKINGIGNTSGLTISPFSLIRFCSSSGVSTLEMTVKVSASGRDAKTLLLQLIRRHSHGSSDLLLEANLGTGSTLQPRVERVVVVHGGD